MKQELINEQQYTYDYSWLNLERIKQILHNYRAIMLNDFAVFVQLF